MSAIRTFVPSIHSVSPSMTQAIRWTPVHFSNFIADMFGAASVIDAAPAARAMVVTMRSTMPHIVKLRCHVIFPKKSRLPCEYAKRRMLLLIVADVWMSASVCDGSPTFNEGQSKKRPGIRGFASGGEDRGR